VMLVEIRYIKIVHQVYVFSLFFFVVPPQRFPIQSKSRHASRAPAPRHAVEACDVHW
jgi:hypothetical protein